MTQFLGAPLQNPGTGTTTIALSIADDFTATATASFPAGALGACQATAETFTSAQAIALGQGINGTIGGYATGGNVIATVGDPDGDVLWLIGSTTDGTGKLLTPGQLFFSSYVSVAGTGLASCPGSITWDAPFQKKLGKNDKVKLHPRHHQRLHPLPELGSRDTDFRRGHNSRHSR
jgi:hypothetical protein